ncbi:MAG: primosomal protein [Caulobacteraceae bacterium]|nr:primosomal protein [Caulobacteraceae bacterium]
MTASDSDFDAQDGAEVLDETNLTEDGDDLANFDEIEPVLDVTRAEGDEAEDDEDAVAASDYPREDLDRLEADEDELDPPEDAYEADIGLAAGEEDEDEGVHAGFDEDRRPAGDIEGLGAVGDADSVEGGEDDFTNFQSRRLDDKDLEDLGYSGGAKRAGAR